MRVAVLGAGYAGVALARRLERTLPGEADLVVVDESDTHLVQHELHRAVRRPSVIEHLQLPLGEVLDRAELVEARVTGVDPDAGVATLEDGELAYDAGAVCLGARTAFYGLESVREHATPLKRVADARAIREAFLDVCARDGRAVVGGAGLSGVQVAGELAALARERDAAPTVVLLEQEAAVAPRFPEPFRRAIRRALQARGVEVRTGSRVVGATADAVELADGSTVAYDQLVWTGGIRGPLDDDRPVVQADLRLGEATVGLGDAVRVIDANGEAVPASAQAAVRQAEVAARNVRRLVEHGGPVFAPRLERFTFDPLGWIVSVGDGTVAQIGPTVLTGPPARALKASVGASYLTSVGAVRRAVEMVNEELGLAAAGPPADAEGRG